MTPSMSIWSLIANASLVVQFVLLTLLVISIASWVTIFQKFILLRYANSHLEEFRDKFWSGMEMSKLFSGVDALNSTGVERIIFTGYKSFTNMRRKNADPVPIQQEVERSMRVALAEEEEKLKSGLPFLATVGSTSPYIGLFGTVWGIMQSFRGLAHVQQATLAVVAPGIAEALIATAIGLFAAIPAVVAYNRLLANSEKILVHYENFGEEFSGIVQRNLSGKEGI